MKIQVIICSYNRPEMLSQAVKAIAEQGVDNIDVCIRLNSEGMSTVTIANYFKSQFDYDIQIGICDDMIMQPNCITGTIKDFEEFFPDLDGFVGFPQINIPNGCKGATGAVGRKYVERFPEKMMYCPNYHHFYTDEEAYIYAQKIGKFHFSERAKVYHYHPAFSNFKPDKTFKSIRVGNNDPEIYNKRKEKGLLWGESFELV